MCKDNQSFRDAYPAFHRIKRVFYKLLHHLLLIILFVFLAGHEIINPRLGESHVDFYAEESRHLLEINAKAWLINSLTDSSSLDFQLQELCNKFYAQRRYLPVWTINFTGTENLGNLIRVVDSAEYYGIPKSVINSSNLVSKLDLLESNTFAKEKIGERIDLEIEATQTAFRYMIYLGRGIIKEDTSKSFIAYINRLPAALNTSIELNKVENTILSMQPNNIIYKDIISQLSGYLKAYNAVSDPSVGIAKDILSDVLFYTGSMETRAFDSINKVEEAIRKFQTKHKIKSNGVLNLTTVSMMAEELKYKYSLIALNLDRIRKINLSSENYIFVNIPEYKLHVFNKKKKEKTFNVIVGKKHTPTPQLTGKLEKIITNPYWTVPRSIANNEMLSQIRNDSGYLQRNGYYIINGLEEAVADSVVEWNSEDPLGNKYWIRQNSGSGNALGEVKFVFPNKSRIFLHDTPSKRLFKKKNRAYSHGCIRVQHPIELAQYLSDKYYAPDNKPVDIKASVEKRKREQFYIKSKVNVYIQYLTCSASPDVGLVFHKDLYNRDKKELEEIFELKDTI